MSHNQAFPPGIPDYRLPVSEDSTGSGGADKDNKLLKKARENPMFPIGIAGGIGALCYSAYKFRHRGNMKVSVYLIHTRMAAQGAVVTAVTLGALYSMYNEFILGKKEPIRGKGN